MMFNYTLAIIAHPPERFDVLDLGEFDPDPATFDRLWFFDTPRDHDGRQPAIAPIKFYPIN